MRTTMVAVLLIAALAGCTDPSGGDADGQVPRWTAGAPCDDYPTFPTGLPQPIVTLETSMGQMQAVIFADAVPITAENFLSHVEAGDYDGTRFHRIISGFMMQGGDLSTRDDPLPRAENIPDEFHHNIRHQGAGLLSMANAGPNTGNTQFFITFGDTPHLDDKHTVFGKVVSGAEVFERVDQDVATADGKPREPVVLERATVERSEAGPAEGPLALWTPDQGHTVPAGGGATSFILVAENCAPTIRTASFEAEAPEGVTVTFEQASPRIPAGQRMVVLAKIEATGQAPETSAINITLADGDARATLTLHLARNGNVTGSIEQGDQVTANYIGLLADGRLFDTSVGPVAKFAADNDLGFGTFRLRDAYEPFDFTPGSGVIEGFTDLAVGMPEGGQDAARIPPEKAYGASGQSPLAGRTLVFELEALDVA